MPESPPIGKLSKVRSRLRAALVWWMHRRRLIALALLLALVVGGAAWATPQVRAWRHLRAPAGSLSATTPPRPFAT